MANTECYKTFDEKKIKFYSNKYFIINTKSNFEKLIIGLKNDYNSMVYRGVREAKYKLYSCAQREWLNKDIKENFHKWILSNIEKAKSGVDFLTKKRIDELKLKCDYIPYLSWMQHYGYPTPLVDWSYDFKRALFFMIYEFENKENKENKKTIDGYFSLYEFDTYAYNDYSHEKFIKDGIKELTNSKGTSSLENCLDLAKKYELLRISDKKLIFKDINFPLPYTNTNENIEAQSGLFLLNTTQDIPLENITKKESNENLSKKNITCYNIHKNLAEYVNKYLEEQGITKEKMFPQETIAKESYKNLLST
jgi:hypothetical protein